jgi:hypothetical protein
MERPSSRFPITEKRREKTINVSDAKQTHMGPREGKIRRSEARRKF